MGKRALRIAVGAAALLVSSVWAQQNVGIGTNTPHPTALLELYSTSKGLLIPRMTQAERDAISSPATGLLIYQTDNTPGFYYWNGTAWIPLLSSSSGSGLFWSLTGNSITGTEFLGTTNAQPLVIQVGNQETFRFNPPGASAPAWSIQRGGGDPRGLHAVDLQSARSAATQVASGDYSVIGGGLDNTASQQYATVGGGRENTASGNAATVGGGVENTASGNAATVGGGEQNTASGSFATVGGGKFNTASGWYATVGGGADNTASDDYATVGGGFFNTASGWYATVGGGSGNIASNGYATVSGGEANAASNGYATIGGGGGNTASGSYATVAGGRRNTASGQYATVGGGMGNTASGDLSAIPGGFYLRVGERSFGFSGQTTATQTDLSAHSNIAAFVDVDLWLYSRDRTQASQLLFYEAQAHGSGANYVALRAPTSLSANTTYTLPADLTTTNTVATGILQTDGSGNLSWLDPSALAAATAWALTGNSITSAWNGSSGNFLGTTNAQPLVIATTNTTTPQPIQIWVGNQETFRFNPPGASAPAWSIQRGGGNQRGLHAVDLQAARSAATQVASGDYSVIGGGEGNTASGDAATVGGGLQNTASGLAATVGGGHNNTADGTLATVGGGGKNTASGQYATVGGGYGSLASSDYATVGGGSSNTASGDYATVGGGRENTASGLVATVGGGGWNTASGQYATVGGGIVNTASGFFATVGGGVSNTASGDLATVGGGYQNTASGLYATVGGGQENTASGDLATVGGGIVNTASGFFATVGGGVSNTASGDLATVGGGQDNTASGDAATVGGGEGNTASGDFSAIPGGFYLRVGERSFGFSGQTSAIQTDLSANSNIAAFVDVDLWLYSRDRTQASQLRFYEAQAHGSGANYVALRAPTSLSANTTYTLPASLTPTSTVAAGILQTDASGNLSWLSPTALAAATAWALTGNSGTNPAVNFLGTTDAQPLVIRTNNTERVRVTATGNVGIGTATPTERLQVSDGNVAITNTDNTARQLRLYEPSGAGTNFTAFQAQAQASDIIYTLPASLTTTNTVATGILQTDASGNLSWLTPSALVTGSAWALTGNSITGTEFLGTTNAQPLVIRTNNTERMRVTATGNVGIGTASPTTALHVVAASNPLRLQGVQVSTQDTALVIDANGVITKRSLGDAVKANAWSLTGNSGTSHLNFLGTTDSARLEIRVRNVPAWRAEPVAVGATPNIIGGMGFVTGGAVGATIGGGGATSFYNEVSDNYGTVAGGYRNIVGNQNTNPADAAYAFIGGGAFNFARNAYAAVAGGAENVAWGQYSFIGGGNRNSTASGATGATVVGGYVNVANGAYAAIGGGAGNFAGAYSAIPGGYNLRIGNSSFGFSGQSSGLVTDLTTYSNIAVFVDVDLWLYSRDRTQASQLRFYEAQAHGSGANYVALRAPTSLSANTTYTLPASLTPTSTVGAGILQTDASGNLSWLSPAALVTGSAWALTGNSITSAWNGSSGNFLGTTNAQPLVIATTNTTTPQPIQIWVGNQETFRFNPPGASAPAWSIQRGGGDPRGLHAVDLQSARSAPTQVASGDYSVIGGGVDNTASGGYATVGGGLQNTASGKYATVGGGGGNTASGGGATVSGGEHNTASGDYATVGGGDHNTASGLVATVGGGGWNTASGQYATVGGGFQNTASGDYSAIPGGYNLRVGTRSFGFSGQTSTTQTDLSANSNIAAFVDVDLWLYSRDRTQASQLRFYEAQAHGSGANYVALRAPTSLSANTTYTLPASDGSPGQVLTTDGNGQLSWSWNSGGTIFVRKTANESVTNSTTPQADDHLYATLPANSIWEVEILLRTQSAGGDANNGGIQVQLNAPTGTSMQVYVEIKKGGSGSDLNHHWHYGWITAPNTSVGYNPIPGTTTQTGAVKLKGLVIVGSTGGTLQLYWAQNAANGNATTVYANSYMKLTRIQ